MELTAETNLWLMHGIVSKNRVTIDAWNRE